jgi:hypothetical protein
MGLFSKSVRAAEEVRLGLGMVLFDRVDEGVEGEHRHTLSLALR